MPNMMLKIFMKNKNNSNKTQRTISITIHSSHFGGRSQRLQPQTLWWPKSVPAATDTLVAEVSASSHRHFGGRSQRLQSTIHSSSPTCDVLNKPFQYLLYRSKFISFTIPPMDAIVYQLAASETIYISVR